MGRFRLLKMQAERKQMMDAFKQGQLVDEMDEMERLEASLQIGIDNFMIGYKKIWIYGMMPLGILYLILQ